MARVAKPDFDRFPRFADALAAAETADLEPGDAVFIPSMWWHNVESLGPLNLLVNYWWIEGAAPPASPFAALALGLMALAPLPESRREIWRRMFDTMCSGPTAIRSPICRPTVAGCWDPWIPSSRSICGPSSSARC
jgi:hypothetical protein